MRPGTGKPRIIPRRLCRQGAHHRARRGCNIVREGHGSGEGVVPRRAKSMTSLSRRRKPMPPNGRWRLSANRSGSSFTGRTRRHPRKVAPLQPASAVSPTAAACRFAPRRHDADPAAVALLRAATPGPMTECFARSRQKQGSSAAAPPLAPAAPALPPGRIDKSQLSIGEPKRLRDKAHLKFVASQPCLICGRQPSDPHHLRFAQPRAIG